MESTQLLYPHKKLQDEFEHVAEALAILWVLRKTYITQCNNTEKVLAELHEDRFPAVSGLVSPTFLASSERAEDEVMGLVRQVLGAFDVHIQYWKDDDDPGRIPDKIWKKLSHSDVLT